MNLDGVLLFYLIWVMLNQEIDFRERVINCLSALALTGLLLTTFKLTL